MSIIYVIISLVNLEFLCAYIIFVVYIRAIKKYDDVEVLKMQYVLSLVICLMFMILFVLDIVIKKTWTLEAFLDCICFCIWLVGTVFNFSTLKRKKAADSASKDGLTTQENK